MYRDIVQNECFNFVIMEMFERRIHRMNALLPIDKSVSLQFTGRKGLAMMQQQNRRLEYDRPDWWSTSCRQVEMRRCMMVEQRRNRPEERYTIGEPGVHLGLELVMQQRRPIGKRKRTEIE